VLRLEVPEWRDGQRVCKFDSSYYSSAALVAIEFDIAAGGRPVEVREMCPDPECHGGRDTSTDALGPCPTCLGDELVSRPATLVAIEPPEGCSFTLFPRYSVLVENYPAKVEGQWRLPEQARFLTPDIDLLAILV
jgi:hypothetical protein